ncbi:MAG: hypothetical protein ABWK01_09945 [Infirmifilum sp.]
MKRLLLAIGGLVLVSALFLLIALSPPPRPTPQGGPASQPPVLTLGENEKEVALQIALRDERIQGLLRGANWTLVESGPWTSNGELIGAVLLIRLSSPRWVSGSFAELGGNPYRADLWLGSLHVFVNFKEGRVVALSPGVARAPHDPPLRDKTVETARGVALSRVPGASAAILNAIFYTERFPRGLALFVTVDGKGESLVAVDLARMSVVENYSGPVIRG